VVTFAAASALSFGFDSISHADRLGAHV